MTGSREKRFVRVMCPNDSRMPNHTPQTTAARRAGDCRGRARIPISESDLFRPVHASVSLSARFGPLPYDPKTYPRRAARAGPPQPGAAPATAGRVAARARGAGLARAPPASRFAYGARRGGRSEAYPMLPPPPPRTPRAAPALPLATLRYGAARTVKTAYPLPGRPQKVNLCPPEIPLR